MPVALLTWATMKSLLELPPIRPGTFFATEKWRYAVLQGSPDLTHSTAYFSTDFEGERISNRNEQSLRPPRVNQKKAEIGKHQMPLDASYISTPS